MYLPLALALAACVTSPPTPNPAGRDYDLRVLTYNVNFGLSGDAAGVAAVAGVQADVVLLQETNPGWETAFVSALGDRYPYHRFDPPGAWAAGGMGILSTYPIESIEQLPTNGGLFFAWRIVLDTGTDRIQILNVHLRPPVSDSGSWIAGYFTTRETREKEIATHAAALAPELPTLVAGDFNEEADGLAIGYLRDRGFVDAVSTQLGSHPTWEWPVGNMTLRFQLDHVLHDARFRQLGAEVIEAGRSDHKPVLVRLHRLPS